MRGARLALAAVVLVSACAQVREPVSLQPPKPAPADFPRSDYERASALGQPVYRVDPERSLVVIEVRKGGSLARLGHDHVVASHALEGYAAPDVGRADLYIDLDDLVVDEPALRAEAGFDTQPSESDIAGTRANMREKVLDTQRYPYALVRVRGVEKRQRGVRLSLALTLHGVTRELEAPAQIDADGDALNVTGQLSFLQSEFGITPFSILGGAIQVQDRVGMRFKIRLRRGP